ncbi:MAG TPA: exonuclease subunit SbcD [Bacillota bacterium]
MNILHTSDWHLGKYLENRERLPEQVEVLDELCRIAEERQVDLVLIAGDIFDTFIPSAAAEELFFDTVERLSARGRRAIVIIAGNHDSPERLCAAKPLAQRNGIILLGVPGSEATIFTGGRSGVKVVQSGPGWLELAIGNQAEHAVIITLPYPSEARLEELLTESMDETVLREAYSAKIGRIFATLENHYREDTVNLAVSHLFVAGGESSDSERPIQLGGALTVEPSQLPEKAQYIALGHLHKPQKVAGAKSTAYYSGSLLPYSFSETGYRKAVYLVKVHPGAAAEVEKIELQGGKPLVRWVAKEGVAQLMEWCRSERDRGAWIDVEVHVEQPLSQEEIQTIRNLRSEIIGIRPVMKEGVPFDLLEENRLAKPLKDLFEDYYRFKTGTSPQAELTQVFLEIAAGEEEPDQ